MTTTTATTAVTPGERAASAVLRQPAFVPASLDGAERAAGRIAERLAPEGPEATRHGSLARLAWSDRMLAGYLGDDAPGDAIPSTASWLSPAPQRRDEARGAALDPGGVVAPSPVAPGGSGGAEPSRARPLRAFSTRIGLAAVQAAELVAASRVAGERPERPRLARLAPATPFVPPDRRAPEASDDDVVAPPVPARSEIDRAAELVAELDAFVGAAGPRVALPAGLGGSSAPFATAPSEAPALAAIEVAAPAAIDRLAFADRWLARFAGASPAALAVLDAASGRPVDPAPPAAAPLRAAPPMVALAAAVVDDDERVPDDVFAAIARAPDPGRPRAGLALVAPEVEVEAERPPTASPRSWIDEVLARPARADAPTAGIDPELAASPAAVVLTGIAPIAAARRADHPGLARATPAAANDAAPARSVPALAYLAPAAAVAARLTGGAVAARGSARPGQVAAQADRFAAGLDPASRGLAADFVEPELVLAARRFGFGPGEALAARGLADGGQLELARHAAAIDRLLVAAGERTAAAGGAHDARPSAAADAAAASEGPSARPALPRGAFLWPAAAGAALGLRAEAPPAVGAALELLAARAVADAGMTVVAAADDDAGDDAGDADGDRGSPRPHAGAAPLPWVAPGDRALSPATRAARALVRATADGRGGGRERALQAFASLPDLITPVARDPAPDAGDAAREPVRHPLPHVIGERPVAVDPAAGVGTALESLVVARPSEPPRAAPRGPEPAPPAAPSASASAPVEPAAPRAAGAADPMPAWIEEAARKLFAEGGDRSSGGMTVAEMVLVSAAPRTQVAASALRADRSAAPAAAASAAPAAPASAAPAAAAVDVDRLAHEVYERVRRMLEIARERSG